MRIKIISYIVIITILTMANIGNAQQGINDKSIKIGIPGPFSGNASSYSKAQIGLDAYYQYINDNGGINGRKIETIKVDTECNEAKGIAAIKKLIHQDKVFLINGNSCSGVALAIKPTIIGTKIPWIVGHAVNHNISTPVEKNIFQIVPTSEDAGEFMAKYAMTREGTNKIAIISHTNEWAKGHYDPLVNALKSTFNVTPILDLTMERGTADATAQVLKIRQSEADFVFAILYEAEMAIFMRNLNKYGIDIPVLGAYGADLENTLKRVGDQKMLSQFQVLHMFEDALGEGELKRWGEVILHYYPDEELSAFSFASIGSGMVVVEALKNSGDDLTWERFIKEMEKFDNYDTGILASKITINESNHAGAKDSGVAAFLDEKVIIYQSWNQPF